MSLDITLLFYGLLLLGVFYEISLQAGQAKQALAHKPSPPSDVPEPSPSEGLFFRRDG